MTQTPKNRQFSLLPESELLVWCARTVLTDKLKERIQQRVQEPLDWCASSLDWLNTMASARYCTGICQRFAATACPPYRLAHLRQRTYASVLLNGLLLRNFHPVRSISAHGVPVIPIQGATLAVSAYGDFTLREFRDIDLIIRRVRDSRSAGLLVNGTGL